MHSMSYLIKCKNVYRISSWIFVLTCIQRILVLSMLLWLLDSFLAPRDRSSISLKPSGLLHFLMIVIIVVMNVTTLMLIKYYLWLPLILINGDVNGSHLKNLQKGFPFPVIYISRKRKKFSSSHSLCFSFSQLSQFSSLISSSLLYIKVRYISSLLLWFALYLSLFYNTLSVRIALKVILVSWTWSYLYRIKFYIFILLLICFVTYC